MALPNIHGNGGIARQHGPAKYICKPNKFQGQFQENLVSKFSDKIWRHHFLMSWALINLYHPTHWEYFHKNGSN